MNISNTVNHYLKNFSWMMIENIVKILIGFTVTIYVVRYLGPKDFGLLSYALSIVGILQPFTTLGLDAILFRNIIKNKQDEKTLLYTALILRLITSIFFVIIVIYIIYIFNEKNNIYLYLISLLLLGLVFNSFDVYRAYFKCCW